MENIKRKIRLFFVQHGKYILKIVGVIFITLFSIRVVNDIYAEDYKKKEKSSNIIKIDKEEELRNENNIKYISQFLDYCNTNPQKAYEMLSEKCITEKYPTLDIFKKEYINSMFEFKKDYEIDKEDKKYKVSIIDGVIESGSIYNRRTLISYYIIEESVLEKKIYIER